MYDPSTDDKLIKEVVINTLGETQPCYVCWDCEAKAIEPDWKGFGERLQDLEDAGAPISMSELIDLAHKYHTPIPIYFDDNNNPIFKEGSV